MTRGNETLERDVKAGEMPSPSSDTPDLDPPDPGLEPEQLDQLRKLVVQFEQAHGDFMKLSHDRPDDAVNPLKISFANQLIGQANSLLERSEKPFADFVAFLDNIAVSNSDLMLVLGQYKCCLRKFGDDRAREAGYTLCWVSGVTMAGKHGGTMIPFG